MPLVQRDHVIQHLTAYAPHPSFRDSVLPRAANARPDSFDPARFQKTAHLVAEFAVTIKDDVAAWKRQGLSELLQNPSIFPMNTIGRKRRNTSHTWRVHLLCRIRRSVRSN